MHGDRGKKSHFCSNKAGRKINMDFHINWENNFLSMITRVHVCSDHFGGEKKKKKNERAGRAGGCIWFGTEPLQIQITTCISRCTRAVMSQGAYDTIGANIRGFDCDDSAEQRQKPMKSPEMLVIL